MQISDWINVALCILSFLLAVISVVTVVITLRQNHRMIENSVRPYIVIKYETIIYPNGQKRYIVVKNYGQTGAKIINMSCSGDTTEQFVKQFNKIEGAFLAPSQHLLYCFGDVNTGKPELLHFNYKYTANGKVYSDETCLQLINGALTTRSKSDDAIKYALQDLSERLI